LRLCCRIVYRPHQSTAGKSCILLGHAVVLWVTGIIAKML